MKTFFSAHKSQLLLLLIAGLWTVAVAFVFRPDLQTLVFGDSISYYQAAVGLYENRTLSDHRPLVIAAINGFPLLFGFSRDSIYGWSLFVNFLCWLGTLLLIFSLARRFVNAKLAFWVSAAFLLCVGNLFIAFHLMSETVFAFSLVLILYWVQKHLETNQIAYLAFAFTTAVLDVMVKPLALFFPLLLLVFFCKKAIRLARSPYIVLVGLSVMLLFFQMWQLQKKFGNFTVSYIDSSTYYNYLGTRADCLRNGTEFIQGKNARCVYFSMLTPSQQKSTASEDFTDQLKNNRANLCKAYLTNLWINASKGSASVYGCENKANTGYFDFFHWLFKAAAKLQNLLFTLLGLLLSAFVLLRWKQHEALLRLIAIVVLYVVSISAISSDQGDRFHIVVYPLILLMCSFFIRKERFND